jgi:hypothetical protein
MRTNPGGIATLLDSAGTCGWENVAAPSVRADFTCDFAKTNGPLLRIKSGDRDAIFKLLDAALQRQNR